MFTKHISDLEFSDIEYLVRVSKEPEGYHLDYKGEIGNPDNFKKVLSKEISSFGNTDGGYLIIGVEDKTLNLVGIEPTIMSKSVDEWINQVLSTNIDPPVFYYDPKVIPIPESDKVIVVIYVPESSKKPHMVSEIHQYFTRMNDSSKPSTHNQVREMFDYSRRKHDEVQEFLNKRNILEEDEPNFGLNINSKLLYNGHKENQEKLGLPKPIILYSVIPKFPYEEKFNLPFVQFRSWLIDHCNGYNPKNDMSVFTPRGKYDMKMDGVVFKEFNGDLLTSYFEIMSNGFIELGCSNEFFVVSTFTEKQYPCLRLTQTIGHELILLGFLREFYNFIQYYDEVVLQISMVNVLDYHLISSQLDDTWGDWIKKKNNHHKNLRISYRFNPSKLTDDDIIQIGKFHSERICYGFGNEQELCFDKNEKIKMNLLFDYR